MRAMVLAVLAVLPTACGSGGGSTPRCVPGASQTCPCSNGAGAQTCGSDGTFGACMRIAGGMCNGTDPVDSGMATSDGSAVDGGTALTDAGASPDGAVAIDAAAPTTDAGINWVSINSGAPWNIAAVQCQSVLGSGSFPKYSIEGCTGPPCYTTGAWFYSAGGVPPAAGTYSIVSDPRAAFTASLVARTPGNMSGVLAQFVAQSGTITVTWVNNRPEFSFSNVPGLDGSGFLNPLSGNLRCP